MTSPILIRDRNILANERVTLADDAALPASGSVIVSLARWQAEGAALASSALDVAVRIPNTADVLALYEQLKDRPAIALEFPAFPDGRAYSQARLLRDRCRYSGEIRATGAAVVRDQIAGMERCGINAFELRADQDPRACLKAFADFSLAYQPAADGAPPVIRRRSAA